MKKAFSSIASILVVVFIVTLLSACDAANNLFATSTPPFTSTPSATFTPAATFTPSPTATPSPTPTPQLPVLEGTPVPPLSEEISSNNINEVIEVAKWGPEMGKLNNVAASPDGKFIILATSLGLYFYDTNTLEQVDYFPTEYSVAQFAMTSDGKKIALSYANIIAIQLFDAQSKKLIMDFNIEDDSVLARSLAISPDGNWLAAGFEDGNITVWNIFENSEPRNFGKHKSAVTNLFFSPDNKLLYTSSQESQVQIYNVATKALFRRIEKYTDGGFRHMKLSADGNKLATIGFSKGGWGWNIRIITWDISIWSLLNEKRLIGSGFNDYEISPDGNFISLLSYYGNKPLIQMWEDTKESLNSYTSLDIPESDQTTATYLFFSPDSKAIGFAGNEMIITWDINTREVINQIEIQTNHIRDAMRSPKSGEIALIDATKEGYRTLNLDGKSIKYRAKNLWSFAYTPDGSIVHGLPDRIAGKGVSIPSIASDIQVNRSCLTERPAV